MRITVYVPKEGQKWKARVADGGNFQREKFDALLRYIERKVEDILCGAGGEKVTLVVDYGQFYASTKNQWKNTFTQSKGSEVIKDLIYAVADYLSPNMASTYCKKYLGHPY